MKRKRKLGRMWQRRRLAVRNAMHWKARWADRRQRWAADPAAEAREREAIFRTIKQRAKETRSKVFDWAQQLPDSIHSKDLLATLGNLLERLGRPQLGRKKACTVDALRVALIRHRIIVHDPATLTWAVAKR